MENDSLFFPFDVFGDAFYDSDGDGELTGFETLMRDADLFAEAEYVFGEEADETKDDPFLLGDLDEAFDDPFFDGSEDF